MGVKLIVEAMDYAPADLTSGQLCLLLVIAENANDGTRRGWPGMELLTRRGRMQEAGVNKAVRVLEERGLISRVVVRTGRTGKPVYAYEGHAVVYVVSRMAPANVVPFAGREEVQQEAATDSPVAPPRDSRDSHRSLGNTPGTPAGVSGRSRRSRRTLPQEGPPLMSPQSPLTPPTPRERNRAAARAALFERTGREIDDTRHLDETVRRFLADLREPARDEARVITARITKYPGPDSDLLPTNTPPRFRAMA